jgi:hypothetical protein
LVFPIRFVFGMNSGHSNEGVGLNSIKREPTHRSIGGCNTHPATGAETTSTDRSAGIWGPSNNAPRTTPDELDRSTGAGLAGRRLFYHFHEWAFPGNHPQQVVDLFGVHLTRSLTRPPVVSKPRDLVQQVRVFPAGDLPASVSGTWRSSHSSKSGREWRTRSLVSLIGCVVNGT